MGNREPVPAGDGHGVTAGNTERVPAGAGRGVSLGPGRLVSGHPTRAQQRIRQELSLFLTIPSVTFIYSLFIKCLILKTLR